MKVTTGDCGHHALCPGRFDLQGGVPASRHPLKDDPGDLCLPSSGTGSAPRIGQHT